MAQVRVLQELSCYPLDEGPRNPLSELRGLVSLLGRVDESQQKENSKPVAVVFSQQELASLQIQCYYKGFVTKATKPEDRKPKIAQLLKYLAAGDMFRELVKVKEENFALHAAVANLTAGNQELRHEKRAAEGKALLGRPQGKHFVKPIHCVFHV